MNVGKTNGISLQSRQTPRLLCILLILSCIPTALSVPSMNPPPLLVDSLSDADTDSKFCFVSFGCWGGYDKASQKRVANAMGHIVAAHNVSSKGPVKFVIAAGDNFYKKGVKDVTDPRFFTGFEHVYNHQSLMQLPFLVALGNHDYRGDFMAQVQFTEFQRKVYMKPTASNPHVSSGRWTLPSAYYSKRVHRDMVVIVLDTPLMERCVNNGDTSPRCWDQGRQRKFLAAELERHKDVLFKVVVGHYPMFANGPHVNFQWLIQWVQPLLEQYNAALYVNADNHYLQVSVVNGIVYANSGGGAGIGVRHTPSNKNYQPNKHSKFIAFTDGLMIHCVDVGRREMVTESFDYQMKLVHSVSWRHSQSKGVEGNRQNMDEAETEHAEAVVATNKPLRSPLSNHDGGEVELREEGVADSLTFAWGLLALLVVAVVWRFMCPRHTAGSRWYPSNRFQRRQ